jgi:acetyltransferase-like isoleucine patch superfamily enzyme
MAIESPDNDEFEISFLRVIHNQKNPYNPLTYIHGTPHIGKNVFIGWFSMVNAKGAEVIIGDDCDIASFVSINVADSHMRCIGVTEDIERKNITIEQNVFIGSHSVVKGGAYIGHHSVVAAGTIVDGKKIPPFSLVYGNPMKVKKGYYKNMVKSHDSSQ